MTTTTRRSPRPRWPTRWWPAARCKVRVDRVDGVVVGVRLIWSSLEWTEARWDLPDGGALVVEERPHTHWHVGPAHQRATAASATLSRTPRLSSTAAPRWR